MRSAADPPTVGGSQGKELDAALVTHRSTARASDVGLSTRSERSGSVVLLKRSPSGSGGRSFRAFRSGSLQNSGVSSSTAAQQKLLPSSLNKAGSSGNRFAGSPHLVPQEEDLTAEETKILLDSFYHFGPIDGATALMDFLASIGEPLNDALLLPMLKEVVRARRGGAPNATAPTGSPAGFRPEGEGHRRASVVAASIGVRSRSSSCSSSSSSGCASSEEASSSTTGRHGLRQAFTMRTSAPGTKGSVEHKNQNASVDRSTSGRGCAKSSSSVDRYLARHFLQPFVSDRDVLLLLRSIKARMVELSRHQDEAKEVFDALCDEGRQSLDANELRLVTSTFKLTIDVEAYLKEVDEDGSGEIELGEFRALLGRVGMMGGGGGGPVAGPLSSLTARRRASFAILSATANDEEIFDASLLASGVPSSGQHGGLGRLLLGAPARSSMEGGGAGRVGGPVVPSDGDTAFGKRSARETTAASVTGVPVSSTSRNDGAVLCGGGGGGGEAVVVVLPSSPEGSSLDVPLGGRDDANDAGAAIDSGTFLRTVNQRGQQSNAVAGGVAGGGPSSRSMSLVAALPTTASTPSGRGLSLSREPTFMLEGPLRAARRTLLESAANPLDAIEAPRVLASYLGLQVREHRPLTVRMTKKASTMKARTAHQSERDEEKSPSSRRRRNRLLRLPPLSPQGAGAPLRATSNSPVDNRGSPKSRNSKDTDAKRVTPSRFKDLPVELRPDGTRQFRVEAGVFPSWREPYALYLQPFPF